MLQLSDGRSEADNRSSCLRLFAADDFYICAEQRQSVIITHVSPFHLHYSLQWHQYTKCDDRGFEAFEENRLQDFTRNIWALMIFSPNKSNLRLPFLSVRTQMSSGSGSVDLLASLLCTVKSNSSHEYWILYTCQCSTMLEAVNRGAVKYAVLTGMMCKTSHEQSSCRYRSSWGTNQSRRRELVRSGVSWQTCRLSCNTWITVRQQPASRQVYDSPLRTVQQHQCSSVSKKHSRFK